MKTFLANIKSTLYIHRNNIDGRVYLGIHRTDEPDDFYVYSSKDPYLRRDYSDGLLTRSVLFYGRYQEAINLEHQLLSKYDAVNNPNFYNKSNGGGALVDKHYVVDKIVFDEACDWVEGKKTLFVEPASVIGSYNQERMIQLKDDVKNGVYSPVEQSVEMLYTLDRSQCRMDVLDREHVETLTIDFNVPSEARKYLTPIVVTAKDGKLMKLLDGNHRLEAAYNNNWVTIPTVILDDDLFENVTRNYTDFGIFMNQVTVHRKDNNTDDLDRVIYTLSGDLPDLPINSDEFINILKTRYGGYGTGRKNGVWTNKLISSRCKKIGEKVASEQLLQGKNFFSYSKSRLDKLKGAYKINYPKIPVITQSIDSICNAGFGGITYLMSEENAKEGAIIVHYGNNYRNWEDRQHMIDKFNKQVKAILAPGLSVKLVFLDAFKEGFES